jgi:hypothetical protein
MLFFYIKRLEFVSHSSQTRHPGRRSEANLPVEMGSRMPPFYGRKASEYDAERNRGKFELHAREM